MKIGISDKKFENINYIFGRIFDTLASRLKRGLIKEIEIDEIDLVEFIFVLYLVRMYGNSDVKIKFDLDKIYINKQKNVGLSFLESFKKDLIRWFLENWKTIPLEEFREIIEVFSHFNIKVVDALYRIDWKNNLDEKVKLKIPKDKIKITSTQSYGRPYLIKFRQKTINYKCNSDVLVILPCSSSRPYYSKNTVTNNLHIKEFMEKHPDYEYLVFTSIGIIPKKYWNHEIVLKYDSGVPDLWLNYKTLEKFLSNQKRVKKVISFLDYLPYNDMLKIVCNKLGIPVVFMSKNVKKPLKYWSKMIGGIND